MLNITMGDIEGEFVSTARYALLMLLVSGIGIFGAYKRLPKDRLTYSFIYLQLWVFFISFFLSIFFPISSRVTYITIILPLLLYLYMSSTTQLIQSDTLIVWTFTVVAALLAFDFLSNYMELNMLERIGARNNSSYFTLYLLPFLLCHKNKIVRIACLVAVFLVVLLSMKRGGLFAITLAAVVYLYVLQIKMKGVKLKIWGFAFFAIVVAGLAFIFNYTNEEILNGAILSRINDIEETGGAGRTEIWKGYLSFINDSPALYLLFGRGWRGSIRDSHIDYTCHNDFLEALVDFGIVGLVLYIPFFVVLIKTCLRMIKAKHEYAPAMGASIAIFFVNSMVAHILIYSHYLMMFALFWGFIVSSASDVLKPYKQKLMR